MDRLLGGPVGSCYLVGHDALIRRCLESGGAGSISAAANVAPRLVSAVHRDGGRQPELEVVRGLLESFGLAAAVKALLERAGIGAYTSRPPMQPLPNEARDRLFRAWDELEW